MLKQKAFSAILWSGADIFIRRGLTFVVSIALARLLTPEEFGTVALLLLFTGVAGVFVDSGFSNALIQRQDVTHTDESTVFWFNLLMGTVMAILLWLSAPLIAGFYQHPVLISLTTVLALNVFIGALGSIHGTLLTKRLDFKTQLKIGVVATAVSGSLGVFLAWKGYGVWALVAQIMSATLISTALLWQMNAWRPAFVFSRGSVQRLFGFGGYLLGSSLLDVTYTRLHSVLIGKFYGVRDLGFYNRADGTQQLPVGILSGILARVALPIFSSAKQDKVKLRKGMRMALRGMMLINIPVMLGIVVVAELLVVVLFGERWLPSVPLLKVLCIGGILWPLHVINLNVLIAQGHSRLFFKLEIIKKTLGTVLLVGGSFFGVMGIAWSTVIFSVLGFFINAHYTNIHLQYGVRQQTLDFLPVLTIAVVMAGIVAWIGYSITWTSLSELMFLTLVGAGIYISACIAFKVAALQEVIALFRMHRTGSEVAGES